MRHLLWFPLVAALLGGCAADNLRREGISAYQVGRYDDAEQHFRQVLVERPSDAESLYYLGRIAESRGNLAEAIYYYQSAVDADPSHAPATIRLEQATDRAEADDLRFIPQPAP